MKTDNLIILGAYLQTTFDMKPNFTIHTLPSDHPFDMPIRLPLMVTAGRFQKPLVRSGWDEVNLTAIGTPFEFGTVHAAYSRATNTLVIQLP